MKQLKISIPDDLRAQLDAASARGGRSLGQVIRERLERSFADDAAFDPVTRELIAGIINLAAAVQADLGAQWHSSPANYEAFAAAVAQRIAGYKPKAPSHGAVAAALDLLGKVGAAHLEQAPDALGTALERADQRIHAYEHLQAAQQARGRWGSKHLRKKEDKS
jgi:hypothetical protein